MRTIELGPFEGVVVHFGEDDWSTPTLGEARLCRDEPLRVRMIHTWTTDRSKVTCRGCLEWMHA